MQKEPLSTFESYETIASIQTATTVSTKLDYSRRYFDIPSLKADFEAHPPRTLSEAGAEIEHLTGIKRSPTQIKVFLKRMGMQSRQVGYLPGKAVNLEKIEEQEQFRINELEPCLAAKAGERAVFFIDAAHFVHRAYLGFVWCFVRIIASPSGRKRFNVLGAVDAVTKKDSSIGPLLPLSFDAEVSADFLEGDFRLPAPVKTLQDESRLSVCVCRK